MKIENTSIRLKKLMKDRNLKQIDIVEKCQPFCKKYNVSMNRSDISQYVSGKTEPGSKKLTILGLALNVPETWLMGYDVPMEREPITETNLPKANNIIPLPETKKIPLLGTIACGEPILAVENVAEYVDMDCAIHADFALRCKGDSMINARIFDGDIVYIREQPAVENGEIAAVLITGTECEAEATLKRVYLEENKLRLCAENPLYKDIVFYEEDMNRVKIIGKAVAFLSAVR